MFVRWQRRSRKRYGAPPLLTAVLVECRRVDGKPRQRTVAYLAGIRERFVGKNAWQHDRFWSRVDTRLDELALDPQTRATIEASIAARVPRVTDENQAQFAAEAAHARREIAAELTSIGIRPPGGG